MNTLLQRWHHLWHPIVHHWRPIVRRVPPPHGQYREAWFVYRLGTIVTIYKQGPQHYRIAQQRCTWRDLFGTVEEYLCAPLEGENACRWEYEADLIPVEEGSTEATQE